MLRNCVIFCCIASANAGKCRLHVKNIKGRQCLKSMISLFSVDGGFSSSTPSLAVLQGTPPIARNIWPALSELVLQLTAGKVKWIHSMVEPLSNEYAPLLFPFLPSAFLGGPSKSSGRYEFSRSFDNHNQASNMNQDAWRLSQRLSIISKVSSIWSHQNSIENNRTMQKKLR